GLQRAPGALQSRFPQRHADRDRGLSGRVHPRLLFWLAADRDYLLARRVGPARLRKRAEPRLSRGVRNAVHLFAGRPCGQFDLGSRLYVDRPADRFRGAGSLMNLIAPQPVETTTQSPLGEAVPMTRHRFSPSPLNRRRWQNFKSNRRGYWSFWIFLILFFVSLFAEFIANDRPFLIRFDGHLYFPAFVTYPETTFGGDFQTAADYRDPYLQKLIADKGGTIVWPLIRYSWDTHNLDLPTPAPSKPTWLLTEDQCKDVVKKKGLKGCSDLEYNWLGTDDQGRDVGARLVYGYRISVLFGLTLTIFSSIIGIAAGGVQGYFGGWIDLGFQRLIEVWNAIPSLYLLLILSSVLVPGFFVLLGILLLFSWVSLVGLVRAEFLRGRNFEYIQAARALGVSNAVIMFRHLLPNAMVATMTFLPSIVSSSVMTLTALDFLGFGLPPGSPSLGELLSQGKANVQAPWLGFTGFFAVAIMLSLLIFIGEAARDAFDPRKTFTR